MMSGVEPASSKTILLNCAFLGWTTEHMAQRAAENFSKGIDPDFAVPAFMIGLQVSFTAFFAIELQLHWWSEGFLGFLKSEDVGWHVLDILCVAVGVVDCILDLEERTHPGQHSVLSQFTVVRGIRVVRILRVVRASRVMQMCRELRMMVFSTVNCLKSVLWITIIFSVIFYMFAIVFTSGVVSYLDTVELRRSSEHSDLQTYFGSLSHSMLSLYMAMAGGNNWTVYYSALASMDNGGIYCSVFLLYITFMLFAVVNIVTGVFVDAAMQSSRADQSVVVQHELETKKHYLDSLKALYEAIDEDSSGMITREMLEASFQNESVLAYLSALKLNTPDASTLFDLLDFDQSDAIDIDEFLLGCYNLHGDASNIDVKLTHAEVRFVKETLLDLIEDVHEMKQQLPGNPSQPTSGLEPGNSEPLMPQTLNPKP
ncbi:Scn8a [Symbiodinium natans]|uniref:Scn8a protein n=1 Tax=Symbiodinium natans TaxID=878477 RepID=A0A812QZJ3_9DINO|nr:Scn8a [Symbiodinium natans]